MKNLRKRFLALFLSLTLVMPSTAFVWADDNVEELQDNPQSSEEELAVIEEDTPEEDNVSETESADLEEMAEYESLQYDEASNIEEEESLSNENASLDTSDAVPTNEEKSDEEITEEVKDTTSIDENEGNPSEVPTIEDTSEDNSTDASINEGEASETNSENNEAINEIENEEDTEDSVIEEVVETPMQVNSREAMGKGTYIYSLDIVQKERNYLNIDVNIPSIDTIISQKKADKVELTATMYYNGAVRQQVTHTQELKSASDGNFDFDVTYFGKWMVSAKFLKDGKVVENVAEQMVGVTAERYNIGAFTASMPVLIFSLKLNGNAGLDTYDGKPVPSIVSMTRHQQYDWNALPENVYRNPLLTEAENRSAITTTSGPRMKAYVQELYALNPDSYFVFYVNDWECRVIFPHLALETNLPQDKYGVRFITDGSATYKLVKEAYGGLDDAAALEKHENLKQSYINFREEVRNGNRPGYVSVGWGYHNLEYGSLRDYVYAMVEVEPDAEWWVIRRAADTFDIESTAMRDKMLGDSRISNNYLNNLLAAVQNAGNTEQFKALYKFDDSAFEATRAKGKKIMEVLGTSKAVEGNFPVKDYIRFTQEYYGDEYEYYYKGHPGWISENEPERVALMDSINMQILESSIAAELFSFYNPDIHMSGYPSTTFLNVGSAEVNGGLYNMTKSAAYADSAVGGYAADMDFFITDLQQKPASDEIMALLEQAPCDKTHSNFLVEFNKTQEDTDIAIWDSTDEVIIYFTKDRNGQYVFDHMVKEAKVTFDANGGSVSPKSKETVKRMISSLPTPTRTGYKFNGWFTAKTGGSKVTTSTTFKKDTTIYAQWTSGEYTVKYDANGGKVSPASVKTVNKKISKLATPTRAGYKFNGWFTAKTGGTKVSTSTTFNKDTTIYAQWTSIEYTVKYDANGGKVSPASVKTVNKKIGKLATPTRTNYKFNGWFTAKTGGTKVTTSTTFNKDTTVYAQWTVITSLRRVYGGTRYSTSLAVAETYMKDTNQSKLNSIVVASGETFPDALAGAYFGNSKKAPIILWTSSKNTAIQKFIKDNVKSGGTVYILGGKSAVGESIKNNMGSYKFKRIFGSTRYSTNIAILDAAGIGSTELLVCDGTTEGKGINAIIAASTGKPIFLVGKGGLNDEQKAWLSKNKSKITKITIIGDSSSVDGTVANQLKAYGTVSRISGANADELSANVAKTYRKNAKEIYIATMNNYPDGLCGGVSAIFAKAPILLVSESKNSASVKYAKTLSGLERATILGGPNAVSETTARKVARDTKSKITIIKK